MRPSINDLMKRAVAGSYDEKFKKEMSNNIFDKYSQRESFDFDLTNKDYLKGDENPYTYNMGLNQNEEDPFNEIRSSNQNGWSELGKGSGRVLSKTSREIINTAGAIGGLAPAIAGQLEDAYTGEDKTTFLQTVFEKK